MTYWSWILLIIYPLAVGGGQILFKIAANRLRPDAGLLVQLTEPALLAALGLYGALAFVWIIIVRELPLTAAYPFVALSFVVTPFFAWLLLNEDLNTGYLIGIAFICAGVFITQRSVNVL